MTTIDRTRQDAFGYATTPYRIECRPTYGPHSKAELVEMLDLLAECGVKAWWYAAAAKSSYPMFASRYLPHRDDAVDYFPWLAGEAHARGIALFSWEYLTTAPMLAAKEPTWRVRYFDWSGPQVERDNHYVCWNSPYGDLLKHYCVEVVGEQKFDGIWFDGAFLYGHGGSGEFACCCDFCADKYRRQTGRDLPATIDLRDRRVREYLEWRYLDHVTYWRDLTAHVRRAVPGAIVAINFFNRLDAGITHACPLRRMAGDAPQWPDDKPHGPMEGMIATEVSFFPQQTMLMGKVLHAVNDNYPVEMWSYGIDTTARELAPANPDPRGMLLHARLCATVGAFASIGVGRLPPVRHALKALTAALDPIAPYVGGEPVAVVGLVVSGCTKDYASVSDEFPRGRDEMAWAASIGAHNLLNALRLPSDVLLDNMLIDSFLRRYPVVVLPAVKCLSDDSAEALRRYVEGGGTLLAIGETATHTELGDRRDGGALDDLFGITWRDDRLASVECDMADALIGDLDVSTGRTAAGLPPTYRLPGLARLVRTESAEVLAVGRYTPPQAKAYTPQGIKRPDPVPCIEGAAIVRRSVGKGQALLVTPDIATAYASLGPHPYSRQLVERLLGHVPRPYTVTAPPNIVVNVFRQPGRAAVHVLNVPDALLNCGSNRVDQFRPRPMVPLDAAPTGPIEIVLPGRWSSVQSPTHPADLRVESGADGARLRLALLDQHAVIVACGDGGESEQFAGDRSP